MEEKFSPRAHAPQEWSLARPMVSWSGRWALHDNLQMSLKVKLNNGLPVIFNFFYSFYKLEISIEHRNRERIILFWYKSTSS